MKNKSQILREVSMKRGNQDHKLPGHTVAKPAQPAIIITKDLEQIIFECMDIYADQFSK